MIIQKDSDVIDVSTNRDDFGRRNFRTSFVISLPKYMAVEVENAYGLVSITRAGETNITNPHGEVLAFDILGPLKVKNSYKDIDVEEVQSECVLEGKNASITVKSVKGGAHIIHRYGKIHLEEMNNKVTVEGSNSAVFGQNINGLMDIQTSYRGVALFDVAAVKIKANSSRIEIEKAKDFLDIKDNYAKLTISNIDGDLYVEGKDLEVYAKYVVGEKIFVSTSYKRVELSKFQENTEIVHSNGDVFLEPMPLTHPIVVQGRYTDIHFIWPPGGKYPTEARVKGGDIDWEGPVALTHQEENDTSTFKAFVDERDEPRILLSTTYGTIKID